MVLNCIKEAFVSRASVTSSSRSLMLPGRNLGIFNNKREKILVNYTETLSLVLKKISSFLLKDPLEIAFTSPSGRKSQNLTTLNEWKVFPQSALLCCLLILGVTS